MKIFWHYQANLNMYQAGKYTVEFNAENSFIELSSQSRLQILLEIGLDDVRIINKYKDKKEAA